MSDAAKKPRPQFRNIHITQILKYRLPAAGVMSILHRVSGAGMFLMLPFLVWLFGMSLTSELSYAQLTDFADFLLVKLLLCGLAWAFIHHFFAGIRHLVSDLHVGITKEQGGSWAVAVMALSLLLSVVVWLKIFGVY